MSNIRFQGNPSGTGTLTIASPNTNSDFTLNLPASGGTFVVDGASQSPTFNAVTATSVATTSTTTTTLAVAGNNISAVNSLGFRNRIINGDMRIDQRNNGASVTPVSGTNTYTVDRWLGAVTQASKLTVQQNAGSVTPPSGFVNYLGVTSSSAYSPTGNDFFQVAQIIEGFNIADLNWGTASAQPATLSFWVRSSLTGTFGGSIATTRTAVWVMPFTYTIPSANTWTYVTVAIPAATATGGTNNNNSEGIYVRFGLGSAGTFSGGTPGTWTSAGNFIQPSGTVSVVSTNGATWQITGVQLEAGSVATPFERRDYGRELIMCQRYCEVFGGSSEGGSRFNVGMMSPTNSTTAYLSLVWQVKKRASPTLTFVNPTQYRTLGINQGGACSIGSPDPNTTSANLVVTGTGYTAGAGNLVQSQDGTTPSIIISAEL